MEESQVHLEEKGHQNSLMNHKSKPFSRCLEVEEHLDQQRFRMKLKFFSIGITELMLLTLISCNIFLFDKLFLLDPSKFKQFTIIRWILICASMVLFTCHIFLLRALFIPMFYKRQAAILYGIFVFLFLVMTPGFIYLVVSAGKAQERLPSSPVAPAAALCPIPWVGYGERCYFFSAAEANWTHSQSHCTSQGGSMVTMETPEEKVFIERHGERIGYWIGLQREGLSQPWIRPDGSLFNQTFPIRGEGLCAYLNGPVFSSTWCTNTRFWICSKPVS